MKANSTTGDFAKSGNRQYLEGYNATRGAYRGTGALVAPNAPVRFVDGEKVEDWIAANSKAMLGWDDPARGKGPGRNPGYTVYILNTWDSAEARAILKPQNEYHVWRINRTDPDTGDFDGIDWARNWGGRYRFMMVDTGAAPNPYEAETWGNRNRSVYGSANYDPPLWEYRAKAPRPVTLVNTGEGIEQAVTPGATWDENQLNFMLGRTVNQATSFRFLHSYLYEPQPATGQYWFSDNVWHDAKAELPWASDLNKLYNQDVVLAGLRTLTPYLTFAGDVRFAYLAEGGADNDADQAMLDQAKQDGDDTAGAPGVSMHTDTAMDYIDQQVAALPRRPVLHDRAGDQRRRREALRVGAADRGRDRDEPRTASRGATSAPSTTSSSRRSPTATSRWRSRTRRSRAARSPTPRSTRRATTSASRTRTTRSVRPGTPTARRGTTTASRGRSTRPRRRRRTRTPSSSTRSSTRRTSPAATRRTT